MMTPQLKIYDEDILGVYTNIFLEKNGWNF